MRSTVIIGIMTVIFIGSTAFASEKQLGLWESSKQKISDLWNNKTTDTLASVGLLLAAGYGTYKAVGYFWNSSEPSQKTKKGGRNSESSSVPYRQLEDDGNDSEAEDDKLTLEEDISLLKSKITGYQKTIDNMKTILQGLEAQKKEQELQKQTLLPSNTKK